MPCFLLESLGTIACLLSVVIPTHCTQTLPDISAAVRLLPLNSTTPCTGVAPYTTFSLLEFPPHQPKISGRECAHSSSNDSAAATTSGSKAPFNEWSWSGRSQKKNHRNPRAGKTVYPVTWLSFAPEGAGREGRPLDFYFKEHFDHIKAFWYHQ